MIDKTPGKNLRVLRMAFMNCRSLAFACRTRINLIRLGLKQTSRLVNSLGKSFAVVARSVRVVFKVFLRTELTICLPNNAIR